MDWQNPEDAERVYSIFMPYAFRRVAEFKDIKTRFCHYTSAEAGLKIVNNREVWLRNSILMNDFSEVEYGLTRLREAWMAEELGGRLKALLKRWGDDIQDEIEKLYNDRHFMRRHESYILSISEHGDQTVDEDKYGRLSMWRAYGGNTNVAFVFKSDVFFAPTDALAAYTSPVFYADSERYQQEFKVLVDGIESNIEFLADLEKGSLVALIDQAFHNATLSTKHPGFKEEREWRVIHSPGIESSENIKSSIETLGGVPQRVYKIPLVNLPEHGLIGVTLPELLDRVLIGPTQYPWPIYEAFVDALGRAGVEEPGKKVFISDIPLRR